MLASEPQTHRSNSNKENISSHALYQSLKAIVGRNEQALMEIRRELKQKVNRSDFLAGISSKVSLSDITTLSNISDTHPQESLTNTKQAIKDEVEKEVAVALQSLQKEGKLEMISLTKAFEQLSIQVQGLEQSRKRREEEWVRELREADQSLVQRVQRKAERSELDKIMHLSSLLAIEFQLIKKRFGTFELDYNLVWKEISALYSQQDTLRSVFETERKDSAENTREKQLQVLLRTCKNQEIVGKLFGEKGQKEEKWERWEKEEVQEFERDGDAGERIDCLQQAQRDHQFSIKNFSERLMTIEKDFDNQSQLLREIKQLKKEYNNSKEEIAYLEEKGRKVKQEVNQMVEEQCTRGVKQLSSSIKQEIRDACEEITNKMMSLFEQCAKSSEINEFQRNIQNVEQQLSERVQAVDQILKKNINNIGIRVELHEDKLRIMGKDMAGRLKIQDFDQIRQSYMTSEGSQALVRKAESQLKKEISQFRESQQTINEVVCSETILARWVWVSGELRGGNLVGWDREAVNTLPTNFIFLQNEGAFRIASSGIYRLEMGFYAKKKPSVQIIVNGKTVVSAVNSSSYVVHHSSGKLKDISNSEVAGLTYYDFFTLQENTRLAIAYTGELGHGFFGIQRL